MLIAIHGVKLYAHCYSWSEALCSLLYMECSFMRITIVGVMLFLIVTHGVRLYSHSFKWSDNLCSLLYLVGSVMLGVKLYAHCYTWSEV